MKRLLAGVLALLACLCWAYAETATPRPDVLATPEGERRLITTATPRPTDAPLPADGFYANAVEIARRIDLLAESSVFMANCDYTYSSKAEIEAVSGGDHTTPARIYALNAEALTEALFGNMPEGAVLPDLERPELRRDLMEQLPDILRGQREEQELSLISLLHRFKVFAWEDAQGCGLLVMLYEDAVPVLVTWYADNGAVCMSASFLPDEALSACESAQQVSDWFAGKGLPPAAFEEVHYE